MLGHKNLHTTLHNAKIQGRKMSEDIKLLRKPFLTKRKDARR
jgi:hypothetical protein